MRNIRKEVISLKGGKPYRCRISRSVNRSYLRSNGRPIVTIWGSDNICLRPKADFERGKKIELVLEIVAWIADTWDNLEATAMGYVPRAVFQLEINDE